MTTSSRHAVIRTGALLLCTVTALLAISWASRPPAPRAVAFSPISPLEMPGSTFRLGNAAGPFGTSAAIGDFNADGRPDEIVADRIIAQAAGAGYRYRIDFAMSGQAPAQVTFDSLRDAVSITVSDVDRDNDLDVVARAVLSGETVGLWLNDGHGHFTSADARQLPASLESTQTNRVTETPLPAATAGEPPRRDEDMLPVAFRAPPASGRQLLVSASTAPLLVHRASSPRQPRAPPQRPLRSIA